jgi:hypothetical protein
VTGSRGTRERRAAAGLAAGAVLGLLLAALSLLRSGQPPPPSPAPAAVALVNGQPISREAFARYVGDRLGGGTEGELDAPARRRLLERMIQEELLLQRGLELELARREPSARRAIVSAVIDAATSTAGTEQPDEETLRAFYREAAPRFSKPGGLDLRLAFVAVAPGAEAVALSRAAEIARRARAGELLPALSQELGDALDPPLPEGPVSLEGLGARLGPSIAAAADRLAPGDVSDPLRGAGGYLVLQLRGREPGAAPPFDAVRGQVLADYRLRRHEELLHEHLEELRAAAEVVILDPELARSVGPR